MPCFKILVVDDSEICREFVRIAMRDRGHDVIALESPLRLLEAIEAEQPDLVLIDVCMPALRGDALITQARQLEGRTCSLVLYSEAPPPELEALARSSGADGFLSKTGDVDALAHYIETVLAENRRPCGIER
jgi:two-component system, OmpR family, response regulator